METEAKIGIVNTQESAPKSREDKFKNTIAFIKAAIAEGAHLKIPKWVSENQWVSGLNMGWQRRNLVVFYGSLKSVDFPMAEITVKGVSKTGKEMIMTYHFALAKDKERGKQILLADPNLQRFRRF